MSDEGTTVIFVLTILTGLLQTCGGETNDSQMLRCPGGGGAKVVRVNTSVARLPRRHEMVALLLLAAAAALALAVSAAGTLTGNSGGEASGGSAGEGALIRARHSNL